MNKKRMVQLMVQDLLYILISLLFIPFLFAFLNDYGTSFALVGKMLPFYLSIALAIELLIAYHLSLYPGNAKKLRLTYLVNGAILVIGGLFAGILFFVGRLKGAYYVAAFPYDTVIIDAVVIAAGGWALYKGIKFTDEGLVYYPYEKGLARKILSSIFRPFFVIISLYTTSAFFYLIGIANYGSETWWGMLPVWLLLGAPAALMFYYEWFFKPMAPEKKDKLFRLKVVFGTLSIVLALTLWFLIALMVKPNFIIEDATNIFMVDFMGSYYLSPYIITVPTLIVLVTAMIISFLPAKKKA